MYDSLLLVLHKLFLFYNVSALKSAWPWRRNRSRAPVQAVPALHRGDVLEVERTLFVHSGIYLGQDRVAHLMPDILSPPAPAVTNTRLILGCVSRRARVRMDSVSDFAHGAALRVNELDRRVSARAIPAEQVAQRAERLAERVHVRYSLLWNNCEHFVTYCRYGTALSLQTDQVSISGARKEACSRWIGSLSEFSKFLHFRLLWLFIYLSFIHPSISEFYTPPHTARIH